MLDKQLTYVKTMTIMRVEQKSDYKNVIDTFLKEGWLIAAIANSDNPNNDWTLLIQEVFKENTNAKQC